jgi:tetratricopeptide (TPR) repeat protein
VARTIDEKFPVIKDTHPEVQARHWAEASEIESAIAEWQRAGAGAVERRALVEAEKHYGEAITLVQALPESRECDTCEMSLRVALGGVMQGTRGFSAAATAQTYSSAKVLAEEVGGTESLAVFSGLEAAELSQGHLRPALALAEQMFEIARSIGSASGLAEAYGALGLCHSLLGELGRAREDLLEAKRHRREENVVGALPLDPGVFALIWAAQNEWHLGHPDQVRQHMEEARLLAHSQNNPYTTALAADSSGLVFGFCGDFSRAIEGHDETVRLATELGFPTRRAFGTIYAASVRARLGGTSGAVERIQEALSALNAVRFQAFRASLLGRLSETQALASAVDDAFVTIEQALQTNPDELIYRPELLRLRGELRLRSALSEAQFELAEQDFREAIESEIG